MRSSALFYGAGASSRTFIRLILAVCIIPTIGRAQIKPVFDQYTLELDGKTLKADEVRAPWMPEYHLGERRFIVRGDTVEELDAKSGHSVWSIKSIDGRQLQWMESSGDTAMLQGYRRNGQQRELEYDAPPQLRRLNVASRKWEAPLVIPADKKAANQRDVILAVRAARGRLAVLTQQSVPGEFPVDWKATSNRLSFYDADQEKPAWSQVLPAGGSRPEPGVHLLAAVMPDYAQSSIQHLSWLGDDILLCAGEKEDLISFDSGGKKKGSFRNHRG